MNEHASMVRDGFQGCQESDLPPGFDLNLEALLSWPCHFQMPSIIPLEGLVPARLIDGKQLAQSIREGIAKDSAELYSKASVRPGLAVFLVGDNPGSAVYVRNKKKACDAAGFYVDDHMLSAAASQGDLLALIDQANADPRIHGILVQLPLPPQIDSKVILRAVSPMKDVDGFHPYNIGCLVEGNPAFTACTPKGIIRMIESTDVVIEGRQAVVIGRSHIVGKPVAMLLMHRNATVTVCHSRTKNLSVVCREADILVAAIGRAHFVKADMVKKGAIVVDVGINRLDDGSLVGDVDFESVRDRASWISPVPGGVGPMTIAMLLANTLEAAKRAVM